MGNTIVPPSEQSSYILSGKEETYRMYNTRVALWHLPYQKELQKYDTDGNKWFDSENNSGEDELTQAEDSLKINMTPYKVKTKTTLYNDGTFDVESKYPNRNFVTENHGKNHIWVRIKDKFNQLVAEKIFNVDSSDGRKTVYTNIKKGGNTFTIVKVYSYDTRKNRATDVVNFAYTSIISAFTKGCKSEKEYYLLNGKEIKAEKINDSKYSVKSKNGKTITFLVE